MDVNILNALISAGSSTAVIAFAVYWLSTWIPKRIERADTVREAEAKSREVVAKENREAIEAVTRGHVTSQEKMLAAFAEQQKYERETCERRSREVISQSQEQHRGLLEQAEKKHREIIDQSEKNHTQLEQFMQQHHASLRELVHGMKNVQHNWAMWKALSDKQEEVGGNKKAKSPFLEPVIMPPGKTGEVTRDE